MKLGISIILLFYLFIFSTSCFLILFSSIFFLNRFIRRHFSILLPNVRSLDWPGIISPVSNRLIYLEKAQGTFQRIARWGKVGRGEKRQPLLPSAGWENRRRKFTVVSRLRGTRLVLLSPSSLLPFFSARGRNRGCVHHV